MAARFVDPAPHVHVRPGHFAVASSPQTFCASLAGSVALCLADRCHRIYGIAVLTAQNTAHARERTAAGLSDEREVIRWLLNSMLVDGAELPWIGATLVSGDRLVAGSAQPVTATCSQVLATLHELGIELTRADIGHQRTRFLTWRVPLGEPEPGLPERGLPPSLTQPKPGSCVEAPPARTPVPTM